MKNFIKKSKAWFSSPPVLAVIYVAALVMLPISAAYNLSHQNPDKLFLDPPPKLAEQVAEMPPPAEGMRILLSMFPSQNIACNSNGTYFVHFLDEDNADWNGWFVVKPVAFKQLNNKTWYADALKAESYQKISDLDIDNLNCQRREI